MTGRPRPAEAYVHGLDGPTVIVPARVAAWLDRAAGLPDLRVRMRGLDPELDAVLVALAVAASAWRQQVRAGSDHGTEQDEHVAGESRSPLTTAEAAALLSISDRGVRKAILDGRLDAQRVGDVWLIKRESLEQFRARRAA